MSATEVATSYLDHISHNNLSQTRTQRRSLGKTSSSFFNTRFQLDAAMLNVIPITFACTIVVSMAHVRRDVFVFAVVVRFLILP